MTKILQSITITFALMINVLGYSQRVKNKGLKFFEFNLPKVLIPKDYTTYSVKYIDLNPNIIRGVELLNDSYEEALDKPSQNIEVIPYKKETITNNYLKNELNLRVFKYVTEKEQADFKILVKGHEIKLDIVSENNRQDFSSGGPYYKGVIYATNVIDVSIVGKKNEVLYEFSKQGTYSIAEVNKYNDVPITSKRLALNQIIETYNTDPNKYASHATDYSMENLIYKASKKIKKAIDYYIKSNGLNFFVIKKAEKYGVEKINDATNKFLEKTKIEYSPLYFETLKAEALKSIPFYENELSNYSLSDKSQRKIHWAILSNLSALYYIIQDYDKAIEYAKQRSLIKFKQRYKLNQQIAENRKTSTEKHYSNESLVRDFQNIDYIAVNEKARDEEKVKEKKERVKEKIKETKREVKEEGYTEGTLVMKNGKTLNGSFKIFFNNPNDLMADIGFSDGTYVIMKTVNKKGNIRDKKIKAKDSKSLTLGDDVFQPIKFKSSSISEGALDFGKLALSGAKERFVLLKFDSPKVKVYSYINNETILLKEGSNKGQSTSNIGFTVSFKKKLAKFFGNCASLKSKIIAGEVKNNLIDIVEAAKEYAECQ